jgi:putative membrane protein
MKGILIRWLILTIAIVIASYLIEGIRVSGFWSALFAAATLGMLNVFLRPVLLILTLPLNILTLGFFTFVINALLLLMASGVISGFQVAGFWSALFGSFVISIVNWLTSSFINEQGRVGRSQGYIDLEKRDDDRWE